MFESHDIPRFPNIVPDKITKSAFHVIENSDIQSEYELNQLANLMFEFPERRYYLYVEKEGQLNEWVRQAIDAGRLLAQETDFFYYRHPKHQRDFVRIRGHMIQFDWERKVVDTQPMFRRLTLTLSEKTKRHLEIEQLLNEQSERNSNPLRLEPNFMGIGLDLKKAFVWLKRKLWRP